MSHSHQDPNLSHFHLHCWFYDVVVWFGICKQFIEDDGEFIMSKDVMTTWHLQNIYAQKLKWINPKVNAKDEVKENNKHRFSNQISH